jgi:aspartyl-tRNA(Asn)/glutamyl-tRNA(Gln) amidotransferase subunit C
MAITRDEVRRVAALAHIALPDERLDAVASELTAILAHVEVLRSVDVHGEAAVAGVGAQGLPLRADAGPPYPLGRPVDTIAPRMHDGFLLVPRLESHGGSGR